MVPVGKVKEMGISMCYWQLEVFPGHQTGHAIAKPKGKKKAFIFLLIHFTPKNLSEENNLRYTQIIMHKAIHHCIIKRLDWKQPTQPTTGGSLNNLGVHA